MENKMIQAQFTERYCPDYEERNFNKEEQVNFSGDWRIGVMLEDAMFAEALENFRQTVWREACEAMRERCQERLDEAYEYDRDDDGRLGQFEKLYRRNSMIEDVLIPEPPKNEQS